MNMQKHLPGAPVRASHTSCTHGLRGALAQAHSKVYAFSPWRGRAASRSWKPAAPRKVRRHPRVLRSRERRGLTFRTTLVALLVALVVLAGVRPAAGAATTRLQPEWPPVLAYYYIWFQPDSWERAKRDYPLLGRYSSDDTTIMRQHIKWAKQAGIDGFIVSWKSTDTLNRRLERLIEMAEGEDFKLVMIYEGLNFEREPLPVSQVAHDFDIFTRRFSASPVFDLYERPAMIWSGSWEFTHDEIASVTSAHRDQLLILAAEKNPADYEALADLVDGNAYYWSSADPETTTSLAPKLAAMGELVHQHRGLWIAPAAPGFDARMVGGTREVERRDGVTFRRSIEAALQSQPDALGVISWNEFSENTHIEPSETYDTRYLEVLAELRGAGAADISPVDFDSNEPAATGVSYGLPMLGGAVLLVTFCLLVIIRRGMRKRPDGASENSQLLGET